MNNRHLHGSEPSAAVDAVVARAGRVEKQTRNAGSAESWGIVSKNGSGTSKHSLELEISHVLSQFKVSARSGQLGRALKQRLTAMVKAYVDNQDLIGAETLVTSVLETIRSQGGDIRCQQYIDIYVFNRLIQDCCRRFLSTRAFHWYDTLVECGTAPNAHTLCSMLNVCINSGSVDRYLAFKDKLAGLQKQHRNEIVYNTLIKGCSLTRDVDEAVRLVTQMMHDGVKVSTRTFNSVIHTCARAKNLDAAESTVALMQSCGVAPDIVTYNTLLDACAISVHVSRSEWWFRQMISKGVKPNAITYSTMCKALSRIGGVQQIEELMERCEKVDGLPLNEQFYASLIIACGAKKPREEARALQAIEEMRSRGLPLANMRRALRAIRLDRRQERELLTQDAAQHKTSAGAAGPKSPCYHVPRSWVEGKHNSINSKDSSIYFQENVETQESLELYEDDFDSQEEEACFDAYEDLGFPIVAGASMSHQLQGLARASGAQGCMPERLDSKELSTSASFPDHLFDVMQDIEEESGYAAAAAAGSSGGERSATVLLDFIKAQGDNLIRVQL